MSTPAKAPRSPVTTHVLDLASGRPASGVGVKLSVETSGSWRELSSRATDADGRVEDLLPAGQSPAPGKYRLVFATEDYLQAQHGEVFYPQVEVSFVVRDSKLHHHIPLLISPFGYSTYRGS